MTTDDRLPVPAHVGVLVGLSAGAYALTLAAVAGIQSTTEARHAAERAPTVAAIHALAAGHDALSARLAAARGAYDAAVGTYAAVGSRFASLEADLAALAATVSEIDGAAAALPDSVPLPKVTTSVRQVSTPASHTTTGASG
jgi:hypothetical protein